MNTRNKQDQKTQGRKTRQVHGSRRQGRNPSMNQDHEQEHPETRMTR